MISCHIALFLLIVATQYFAECITSQNQIDLSFTHFVPFNPPFICNNDKRALSSSRQVASNHVDFTLPDLRNVAIAVAENALSLTNTTSADWINFELYTEDGYEAMQLAAELIKPFEAVNRMYNMYDGLMRNLLGVELSKPHLSTTLSVAAATEMLICIGLQLKFGEISNPRNIAAVACNCMRRKARKPEGECLLMSAMAKMLACSSSKKCTFTPLLPPIIDIAYWTGDQLSLPLVRVLPTPEVIEEEMINDEARTYFLAVRLVDQLYSASQAVECQQDYTPQYLGWDTVTTFYAIEVDVFDAGIRLPFAQLSSRRNRADPTKEDILITIRGTQTGLEWAVDFSYAQILQGSPPDMFVPMHRGFAGIAASIWASLQPILMHMNRQDTLGFITIAGHSLGAGVASVLGYFVGLRFPTNPPQVILIASPRVGTTEFVEKLARMTVLRSFAAEYDPVLQLPCAEQASCPATLAAVPTGRDVEHIFQFADFKGKILVS